MQRRITAAVKIRTGPVDWEDVRHFAALARHGSLSAAARALGVNHATVSRRVAALEERLGRRLFDRRGGGFSLTAAGAAALERAGEMERAAGGLGALDALDAATAGVVRLTSTPALLEGFLVARLGALQARHPRLELELIGDARSLSLSRHQADLALRLGAPRSAELVGRRVATVAYAFYAAPRVAGAFEGGAPVSRIGFDDGSAGIPEAAWLAESRPDEPRPMFRTNGFVPQQLAARAGLGIALLPRFLGDADPGLRAVPGEPPPPRPLWLLRRASSARDPRVRAVAEFLVQLFAEHRGLFAGRDAG